MTCRSCRIPDSETIMPLPLGVDPRFTGRERQLGLDLLRALAIIVVVIYPLRFSDSNFPAESIVLAGSVSIFSSSSAVT